MELQVEQLRNLLINNTVTKVVRYESFIPFLRHAETHRGVKQSQNITRSTEIVTDNWYRSHLKYKS